MGKDIEKRTLAKLTTSSKGKIISIFPKLSSKHTELLFSVIDKAIECENISHQKQLSFSELSTELELLNGHLAKALLRISNIRRNQHADTKLDFHYFKANSNDNFMLNLYSDNNNDSVTKPISGYAVMLDRMINGVSEYRDFLKPSITKGRDRSLVYCHLILDVVEFFEAIEAPYTLSGNEGTNFVQLIDFIIDDRSGKAIKNAIKYRSILR